MAEPGAADPWAAFNPQPADEVPVRDAAGLEDAAPADDEWQSFAPQPRQPRGVLASAARGLGLGARDVIEGAGASIPGMIYDAAAAPLSLLSLAFGRSAPTMSQTVTGEQGAPVLPAPRSAVEHTRSFADFLGLPEAETRRERVQSRIGRELVGAAGGAAAGAPVAAARHAPAAARAVGRALAEQPVAQATGALASGAAGAAVEEGGGGTLAQMGAAIPAGVAGAVLPGAARALGQGAAAALAPLTESGRQRIVGRTMLGASSEPATLATRLGQRPPEELPGVRRTSAEVADDAGLFSLERGLRSTPEGGPEFAIRDAERDVGRRQAMLAIEPDHVPLGDTVDDITNATGRAPEFQRSMRAVVDERTEGLERGAVAARGAEAEARGALPPRGDPVAEGADIRAPMAQGRDEAREQVNRLYRAIDPDDESRIPLDWVRAAADDAEGTLWGPLSGGMPPDLRRAVDDLRAWRDDLVPWRHLQDFRSRLGKLSQDDDARVQATAAQMLGAIDDTARAAAQPRQMAGPTRTAGGLDLDEAAQGLAGRPDVDAVLDNMRGASREAREGGISLVQFLRQDPPRAAGQARGAFGGVRDPDGHLRNILDGPRTMPGLIDQRGRSYEQAMEAAIDAGYFPGRTIQHDANNPGATLSLDEFLEAIGEEVAGRRRIYPPGAAGARAEGAEATGLRNAVDRELDEAGGGVSLHDGRVPVGRALREQSDEAPAAPMDRADGTRTIPEENRFTPEQAQRWEDATAARTDMGQRFDERAVGDVLRTAKGTYQVPDSGVAQRFFRAGSGSAEAADQFIAAVGGGRAGAERALFAHATRAMEDYARGKGGAVSAERMHRWVRQHEQALGRFPALRQRLNSWADKAGAREGAEAAQVAWSREADRGALRAILGQEPEAAVRQILRSNSGEENVRKILGMVGNHPGAVTALRRAWIDEWIGASASNPDFMMRERLSPAKARQWLENTERAANVLFAPGQWRRIQQIHEDFQSGTRVANVGRAIGSNTLQNASTAYFISRLSGGTIAPEMAVSRLFGSTVGKVMGFIAALPAEQVRRLMLDAAADPVLARELVLKATPERAAAAGRALARLADPQRFRTWMRDASVREGLRGVTSARVGYQDDRRRAAGAEAAP